MSNLHLNISDNALEDIENIYLYSLYTWSEQQASVYVNTISETIMLLVDNPFIGKNVEGLTSSFRSFPVNKHVIFYHLNNENLTVIRILHENADYKNHLH